MSGQKILVAITGGSGSGKTTQCKLLVDFLTDNGKDTPNVEYKEISKDKLLYCFTLYPKSGLAVIGKLGSNQCTGLDSVYSKLGAEGVCKSVEVALRDERVEIIIIECLFFTFSWYERWVSSGIRPLFKLIFVHLEQNLFDNFRRIQQRRFNKLVSTNDEKLKYIDDWRDVPLEDTVYKNVGSKNSETRVIFDKINGTHAKSTNKLADVCLQINSETPKMKILQKIIKSIFSV